jgi:hypothetical protein
MIAMADTDDIVRMRLLRAIHVRGPRFAGQTGGHIAPTDMGRGDDQSLSSNHTDGGSRRTPHRSAIASRMRIP